MDVNIFLVVWCFFVMAAVTAVEVKGHEDGGTLDSHDELEKSNVEKSAELFQRLESNEKLMHHLLGRVEYLETREKEQQREIQTLRKQLDLQTSRSTSLEKLIRRQTAKRTHLPDINTDSSRSTADNEIETEASRAVRGENEEQNRIRRADNENPVAFFAGITSHVYHAVVNQSYIFDHAITNIGNAYNIHNGYFIAPVDGTYVFSVTLMSLYHANSHARFFKNDQPVTWLYVSGAEGGYDTTSQTIILQLQHGDDVSIHNVDNDVSMAGNHFSTFSGFLLYESFSNSVVVGK